MTNLRYVVTKTSLVGIFLLFTGQLSGCNVQESQVEDQAVSLDISLEPVGDSDLQLDLLPMPFRLAFMAGHVRVGIALYREGELQMAAPHLLHPVSETHAAERVGLDKLGFDSVLFDQVSLALENNRPAVEIESLLDKAEANIALVTERVGGDRVAIIKFLLNTIIDEYSLSISDGNLTNIGEYQDAYGFSQVAINHARKLHETQYSGAEVRLENLTELWLLGPKPVDSPTPVVVLVDEVTAILASLQ